jgi:uncharacterized double-CXXCG motif protein
MRRFFWVDEDRVAAAQRGGLVDASHKWGLPGLRTCPACAVTWSSAGHHLPSVDLSRLAESQSFEEARPEPYEEFMRLRDLVRPLVPPETQLPPGTEFGPLVGRVTGKVPDFAWSATALMIQNEPFQRLQEQAVNGLRGFPTELRFRQKQAPALLELEIPLQGHLHRDCMPPDHPGPCKTCGRMGLKRPDDPILDAASLPTEVDLFRLGNLATMVIGTERFKDAVSHLGLEGLTFREVPTR